MIKAHIFFENLCDESIAILRQIRKEQLPVKLWLANDDLGLRKKHRMRDVGLIEHEETDRAAGCYAWDAATATITPMYNGAEHLPAHINQVGDKFVYVCIPAPQRGCMIIFQDGLHHHEYPKGFFKIPAFGDFQTLKNYLDGLPEIFELNNNPRFRSTGKEYQGKVIYQEKDTQYYWYLDNFHRTHYEVFNNIGEHIGEADLNGNINFKKKEKKKKLYL